MKYWLKINLKSKLFHHKYCIPWKTIFGFILWEIWLCRNKTAFDNGHQNTDIPRTITKVGKFFVIAGNVMKLPLCEIIGVKWEAPTPRLQAKY